MKILIMPAIFQALTRSFTYVSLMINSKHSLETSVIQRLDFFFHIQDFFFPASCAIVSRLLLCQGCNFVQCQVCY